MKNRDQETTNREKSVNIKLDDLLPRNNVKGGKGKTVFGAKNSKPGISDRSSSLGP